MLDLDQLRCFVVVAEEGTVARASELLHLAPSPLSRRIRLLERTLGVDLFDRHRQRLTLTPVGADFLAEARRLLDHADRVVSLIPSPLGRGTPLAVGLVEGIADTAWFLAAMARFVDVHPSARVEIDSSMRSHELFAALADGVVDVAFTHRTPPQGSRLAGELVDEEPLLLAVPTGHPLAVDTDAPVPTGSLDGERFILLSPNRSRAGHAEIIRALDACGVQPGVHLGVSDPRTVLSLVRARAGIGLVRAGSAQGASGVVVRRPPIGFDLTVSTYFTATPGARDITREYRSFVLDETGR